jgi:Carboxypeptidase regulatory-like domain/TonB dependent receptor
MLTNQPQRSIIPTRLICAILTLLLTAFSMFAQIGRASLTGIVRDQTGSVVPGVSVTAANTATGLNYKTTANDEGIYTLGALPVGEYRISFQVTGFKEVIREGVILTAGQIARIDPTFEIGQVTEKVTVTADASLLQTESSQSSASVTSRVFSDMPLSFGSGRNMSAFADRLVPGVSGDYYAMSIQGTPGASQGIIIDGMTNLAGFLPGDFAEASISPEAIQELNVYTGNVSAEHGRQGGGTLNFTLKSGTNQLHGSAFYFLRNELLNANDWNNNRVLAADPNFTQPETANFVRPKDRRNDWGFSGGGPLYIPRVYDGRNKSFFYFTLERFKIDTSGPGQLTRSVPQPEMWDGNLSRLLTNEQVKGLDALGRQFNVGQIFDPATLRSVTAGQVDAVTGLTATRTGFVSDPFEKNIIPENRISDVARNFAGIFNEYYPPVNGNLINNLYDTRYYLQNIRHYTLKVDHSFSPNHKLSGYYYKHGLPRNFQEGWARQVWSLNDPEMGGPLSRSIRQERRGYNWNVSYDWFVNPRMLNHASFGINYNFNAFRSRQIGKEFADQFGITGVGLGQPESEWTRPVINLGDSPVATFESWNHDANGDGKYRGIIVSDTFSYQRGTHNIKFGFEYNNLRYQDFNFSNTGGTFNFDSVTTAIPGEEFSSQLGNSFASFLLGEVNSANVTPVLNPTAYRTYAALFVQDSWKVNSRLTLNYGLRWSGNSPIYEEDDRLAHFSADLRDPNFGNIPGAVEYMGTGSGRAGRRTLYGGNWKDFGPSFGFAYRVTDRVVARGGYGITYTPEAFGWDFADLGGFRQTNSLPANNTLPFLPVFNIDNGYPGQTEPANLDPSYAARFGGVRMFSPDYIRSGYVQSFNFGVQTEINRNLMLDIEWRGSKGTRLHSGSTVFPNQIHPKELSRGDVLAQNISSPEQAAAAGLPYPYPGFSGQGGFTLLPFPQLGNRELRSFGNAVGFSTYHSLNVIATKRMAQGYYIYGAYTFSKAIANVTDVNVGGNTAGIQDTYNRILYKSISSLDRTHVFKSAIMWDLPMGRGKKLLSGTNRVVNAVVSGWTVSAILNYASGTPLWHPNSRSRPNFWNGPDIWANFNTPAGGFKRIFNPDTFNPAKPDDPGNRFIDPGAFSDAAPQSLGTSPNMFPKVRVMATFSEDASLIKRFSIREGVNLQFRVELLNLFNRHYFDWPDMDMNSASFGNITRASGNRTGQFGMRMEW